MEVYSLTKSDLKDLFDPGSRVSDLFSWLEKDFNEQKKLVCQFIINGQEISEAEELDWAGQPLEVINQLVVKVQDEKDLVFEVLQAWIEAIPELVEFIEKKLLKKELGVRIFKIQDILAFVDQQESFVQSMLSLKLRLKRDGLNMSGWDSAEKALHSYVAECLQHLESKNFVQLIETLEYDGAHVLEMWRQLLLNHKDEVYDQTSPVLGQLSVPTKKAR